MQSMIVFSHLRWDFVFQRPQHLMTRLARTHRVFFLEEPVFDAAEPWIETSSPTKGVVVCRPHTPIPGAGFADEQFPVLRTLLQRLVQEHDIGTPVAWMYTPMALPLLEGLPIAGLVYDCMDELSAFLNAPRELLRREAELLKLADVVFTGGPSLYRAKQGLNPNVHCFPSSVQQEHFGRARDASIDHAEQRAIPHPRLGFFGVIDERFDPESIALLADTHPQWQVVLVGPVVKIDPATLPRRPNIHYMGQRSYQDLPAFLAGWDVCLLPFAINESTRFISPTKVLEYMAAEKEIVSSPVTDVVEPYGHIVHIGADSPAFVAACEQAMSESPEDWARRVAQMREVVRATSWEMTATKMSALIDSAVQMRRKRRVGGAVSTLPVQRRRAIVIGAGPTGLSAAYHLRPEAGVDGDDEGNLLLDQNTTVGGWCRSVEDQGFTFDYAGHIMFSNDPYVHELYGKLLGDNVHWQNREAWIYSKNVFTRYPFQGALYGLPHEVLKECIVGAIEARFGPLKEPARISPTSHDNGASLNGTGANNATAAGSSPSACKAESITDCCADGVAESTLTDAAAPPGKPGAAGKFDNFEDFILGVWGRGVAKHFALPYNRKLWTVPLREMETSWLGGRVPMPDLEEMIDGALRPVAKPQGPNARFGYPLRGGFQALMDGFLPLLRTELKLDARVTRVTPSRHLVQLADGSRYTYQKLISTMPLPRLIQLIGDEAPPRIQKAAALLRHVSVRCVNLGIARENITDKHWIYYPEDTLFHRIFVQGNASPHNNPAGGFGLTCEITYSEHKPLPLDGDALIERCIADCIKVGILTPEDRVIARNQVDMPCAYVIYDHARAESVDLIRQWLAARDIELAGRYSEWEYYNSDHAFLAGKKVAERVEDALRQKQRAATTRSVVTQLLAPAAKTATSQT